MDWNLRFVLPVRRTPRRALRPSLSVTFVLVLSLLLTPAPALAADTPNDGSGARGAERATSGATGRAARPIVAAATYDFATVSATDILPGPERPRANVRFFICRELSLEISQATHTSLVYLVNGGGEGSGRVPIYPTIYLPGEGYIKVDGIPLTDAGVGVIEVAIGESFPGWRFMLLPGDNDITLCNVRGTQATMDYGRITAQQISQGSRLASVRLKVNPQAALLVSDPQQTSFVYLVNDGGQGSGRIAAYEALRQPGSGSVKIDGIPMTDAGISIIEVSLGERFPAQRFMLLPGDNEIEVNIGEYPPYAHISRRVVTGGRLANVWFTVSPEALSRLSDPYQTSIVFLVNGGGTGSGRLPLAPALAQPGISYVKLDGIPLTAAGVSIIEVSLGEEFPNQRFMLLPGDNYITIR